ncbi:ROK family transcriptional regulator [Actinocorallia longicatena]|uniref:ROK family transcriptional regulator n=1 Tax=Actinocorallia longicatena TaxID=111803 RepID=A0ABP6QBW3_9ACTN
MTTMRTALRLRGLLEVLRHVHAAPAVTRAGLARELGLSRSSATEIVGRLRALALVEETEAAPTGERGRPTTVLGPHPEGPVVAAFEITQGTWKSAVAGLGGEQERVTERPHGRVDALDLVAERLGELAAELGPRLRAAGVAVPGTLSGGRVVQAVHLGWDVVDVAAELGASVPVVVRNDATLAGVAEARRGAARDRAAALHLTAVDVGIGGVLIDGGSPVAGGTGAGGEFGHLPFGDPAAACPCGASGCWELEVNAAALAGRGPAAVARSLGRGIGGLVNALDPTAVTLSGLAADLLGSDRETVEEAYAAALMSYRRAAPPPLLAARFPYDGPLRGAAELAYDTVLSEAGLTSWQAARGG